MRKSELTPVQKNQLSEKRGNYIAHSLNPKLLNPMFDAPHGDRVNTNEINVVSDIHHNLREVPFTTTGFNIVVGDLSDYRLWTAGLENLVEDIADFSVNHNGKIHLNIQARLKVCGFDFTVEDMLNKQNQVPKKHNDIVGIAVIGNHDIMDLYKDLTKEQEQILSFTSDTFYGNSNAREFMGITPENEHLFRIDPDDNLFNVTKIALEKAYKGLTFLTNESTYHGGIRYIGLNVPICYISRKNIVQRIIADILLQLLDKDKKTPTVIISHAPICNELSLLSPKSNSYNKDFYCVNQDIHNIIEDYNIIGFIHGPHHISSYNNWDIRSVGSKKIFIACSIYSGLNSGIDLSPIIDNILGYDWP